LETVFHPHLLGSIFRLCATRGLRFADGVAQKANGCDLSR
jgi:hypothetical protein